MPLVSILMSAYNSEKYVSITIKSILAQSYSNFELLIMNDGSTDKTKEILDEYSHFDNRIKVIHQENQGLTASLNTLIKLSKGEFLARIDSDDIAYPERLARQVDYMLKNPEIGIVSCWTQIINATKSAFCICYPDNHETLMQIMQAGYNPIVHSSVIMRRILFGDDPQPYRFKFIQDFDLWLRLSKNTKFGVVEEVLVASRDHIDRMSVNNKELRSRIHNLILDINRNDDDSSWQEREQLILNEKSVIPKQGEQALGAYQVGRSLWHWDGYAKEMRKNFINAMKYKQLRRQAIVFYLSSFMPVHWRNKLFLNFARHFHAGFQYFRLTTDVFSRSELKKNRDYLLNLENDPK